MNQHPTSSHHPSRKNPIQISTGARLHFGLLDTAPPFGGCGVMIEKLGARITVHRSRTFTTAGPDSDRIKAIARRLSDHMNWIDLPRCKVQIDQSPLAHSGLGSGTQLSLAVAEAMCQTLQIEVPPNALASQIAGRGLRSAVGIHGYFTGGLIIEGEAPQDSFNACQHRIELPADWRIVVMLPRQASPPVCGECELHQFRQRQAASTETRDQLRQILHEQLLPAANDHRFDEFTNSLHHYNRLSGQLFDAVQGGSYNGPVVHNLIDQAIANGGHGVGQSSWGPAVFAWFENQNLADKFCLHLPSSLTDYTITSVRNQARFIDLEPKSCSRD